MSRYLFGEYESSQDAPNWTVVLMRAHTAKIRPVCLCKSRGERPQMYIAKLLDAYCLKRMPLSGSDHAPHCEHYDPPPEISGLGQVSGSAIRADGDTDLTLLTLDFALTKGRARPGVGGGDVEHESVRSDGTKLTMRATLHYLLDQAGLNRWSPRMNGRRTWAVVRRELYKAAADKRAKGFSLSELLFIPETFFIDAEHEIAQRRATSLARLSASPGNRMLIIAPVKLIERVRFGYRMTLKHMPDMPLMLTDELHKRMERVFGDELTLWGQIDRSQVLLIGTISLSPQGIHVLESICLTNMTETWLPFESFFEFRLLDELLVQDRRFVKGLRYNLPSDKPLASVVLQDTGDISTALYIVRAGAVDEYAATAHELAEKSGMQSWFWNQDGAAAMPELPRRQLGDGEHVQRPNAQ